MQSASRTAVSWRVTLGGAVTQGPSAYWALAWDQDCQRYAKDSGPDDLRADVHRLNFGLPPIARFDIEEGLAAAKAALERKPKAVSG
jgi:hypothetical protein